MTGLVSKATLLTVFGLVLAGAALAGQPNASTSSKPACIGLTGSKTGVADPKGQFTITVRDVANNTIANSNVKIDFSNCVDMHLGTTQPGGPGVSAMTVSCATHSISALTNASGVVTFRIIGSAQNPTGGVLPKSLSGCASVSADNFALGTVTVNAYNEDGSTGVGTGVGGNDLSAWLGDFFTAGNPYFGRSDFDCSGAVGGNDLSVWLTLFFAHGSDDGATAQCSPAP